MTNYEWDIEETDGYGDIVNHNHADKLDDLPNIEGDLVLIRDTDHSRSWAYVIDGVLPEYFSDAFGREIAKVPKRFHTELKNKN